MRSTVDCDSKQIMNWKESVMHFFKVLSRHSSGKTEDNHCKYLTTSCVDFFSGIFYLCADSGDVKNHFLVALTLSYANLIRLIKSTLSTTGH
jgi:hypothetical protein